MTALLKVALAQINTSVGAIDENVSTIKHFIKKAQEANAELILFPEMTVTGYPPQDLLYEEGFIEANNRALKEVARVASRIVAVVGFVDTDPSSRGSDGTVAKFNAAALLKEGKIIGVQHKTLLPTYDVFDETRYFTAATRHTVFSIGSAKIGVQICEDLWDEDYLTKVTQRQVSDGAQAIFNLSASPFYEGKTKLRKDQLSKKAKEYSTPFFYTNLVGGQDEQVFDGGSMAVDARGRLIAIAKLFDEDLTIVDIDISSGEGASISWPGYRKEEQIYRALVLGIRDYFRKTNFTHAIVGLSGGIDSSLTVALAVSALGKDRVTGIAMPSDFSSKHSLEDATALAKNLDVNFAVVPIQSVLRSFENTLQGLFKGLPRDVAEENLQARIRGGILMALANKRKALVVSTGNKTELALGYCTLYGDMVGGLAAIGDVSKTGVYSLAKFVNDRAGRNVIPRRVFRKQPSAELRENQVDPFDYSVISPLVDEIIERRATPKVLRKKGYLRTDIDDTFRRVFAAEYKRRQGPPTIKITQKAFGIGRKYPVVNRLPTD